MHVNQEGHSHKYTNRETNTKGGNSLVAQRLGHSAFTAMAQVQSLVRKLRSQDTPPLQKKKEKLMYTIVYTDIRTTSEETQV